MRVTARRLCGYLIRRVVAPAVLVGIVTTTASSAQLSKLRTTSYGALAVPGSIEISQRSLDDDAALRQLLDDYGLDCSRSDTFTIDNVRTARAYTCRVGNGHEAYWVNVLSQSRLVSKIDLAPLELAMAGAQSLGLDFRPSGTLATSNHSTPAPLERVLEFFAQYFASKGRYRPDRRYSRHGSFVVDHMQGTVITRERYWEYVEVHVVITADQAERVSLMIDGRYAPGLGQRPPALDAYLDMGSKYQKELELYAAELVEQLNRRFGR
jgi:hypothetical protein